MYQVCLSNNISLTTKEALSGNILFKINIVPYFITSLQPISVSDVFYSNAKLLFILGTVDDAEEQVKLEVSHTFMCFFYYYSYRQYMKN